MKILALLLLLGSSIGFAQGRSIDFTNTLSGIDGKPLLVAKDQPMTLSDACVNALETPLESDKGLSGAEKFKLDDLARRIYQKKDAVLTAEDIATLKERVGKAYGPLVVGQVWRLLDPAAK